MSEHQSEEIQQIEKLYEFSERLNASKDKSQVPISPQLGFFGFPRFENRKEHSSDLLLFFCSQNVEDYEGIIKMAKTSMKAKQLASQLIPRYFKFFPTLSDQAFDAHMDCIDEENLGVCTLVFLHSVINYP